MADTLSNTFDKEVITYISDLLKNNNRNLNLVLYQPTFKSLGCLGIIKDVNMTLNFNDKSPLSFTYSKYIFDYNSGKYIKQQCYDDIQRHRLIKFIGIGWFYIEEVEEFSDGVQMYKTVTCYSYEHQLTHRSVNLWSDKQSDENSMTVTLADILKALKKQTGWKIPDVDNTNQFYYQKVKTINIELNTSWYEFLRETVQSEFDVIFFFDYKNLSVDVKYSFANDYLRTSGVVLSFDNFMKDISITEGSQKCATALYVTGDNIGIEDVNPIGNNIIYNFDYYKNTKWMSQGLIDAINTWEEKIEKWRVQYKYLCGFRNYLIELQTELEAQAKEVLNKQQEVKDILAVNSENTTGGLWSKYGSNLKILIMKYNSIISLLDVINQTLFYLSHKTTATVGIDTQHDMYSLYFSSMSVNSNSSPQNNFFIGGSNNIYSEWEYNEMGGNWIETQYKVYDRLECKPIGSDTNAIDVFKLNNNYYGNKLIELHNSGEPIQSIATLNYAMSWKVNFTSSQLTELSKFIIDASYNSTELSYKDYDSYFNYIDCYNLQLGKLYLDTTSTLANPDDNHVYGLGYWTTNFIPLPNNNGIEDEYKTYLYFYDRETGEKIKPVYVAYYDENKNFIVAFPEGANGFDNMGTKTTKFNNSYTYCRASFQYNNSKIIATRQVSAIIGEDYDNNTKHNIDTEEELYTTAKRLHSELIDPCKSFSINVANFLSLEEFSDFAADLQLGDKIKAEIECNKFIDVRFLSMNINFEDISNLSLEFANKYNVYNDVLMFRKLVGSDSNTFDIQNSFNSFEFENNNLGE